MQVAPTGRGMQPAKAVNLCSAAALHQRRQCRAARAKGAVLAGARLAAARRRAHDNVTEGAAAAGSQTSLWRPVSRKGLS